MIVQITTNIVAALAITTVKMVPCGCPDNIPGCCTLHMREAREKRLEPVKVDERYKGNQDEMRGIAISEEALTNALSFGYTAKTNVPALIPVRVFFDGENIGKHTIGFIIKDALFSEIEKRSEK